jgi:hypothetical protein
LASERLYFMAFPVDSEGRACPNRHRDRSGELRQRPADGSVNHVADFGRKFARSLGIAGILNWLIR